MVYLIAYYGCDSPQLHLKPLTSTISQIMSKFYIILELLLLIIYTYLYYTFLPITLSIQVQMVYLIAYYGCDSPYLHLEPLTSTISEIMSKFYIILELLLLILYTYLYYTFLFITLSIQVQMVYLIAYYGCDSLQLHLEPLTSTISQIMSKFYIILENCCLSYIHTYIIHFTHNFINIGSNGVLDSILWMRQSIAPFGVSNIYHISNNE